MIISNRNHLRKTRKTWKLSQNELAYLIGLKDRSIISRLENGDLKPTYRQFICLRVVFGLSPSELFPSYYGSLEEQVMRNAAEMLGRLERRSSEGAAIKRKLLHAMAKRAINNLDV